MIMLFKKQLVRGVKCICLYFCFWNYWWRDSWLYFLWRVTGALRLSRPSACICRTSLKSIMFETFRTQITILAHVRTPWGLCEVTCHSYSVFSMTTRPFTRCTTEPDAARCRFCHSCVALVVRGEPHADTRSKRCNLTCDHSKSARERSRRPLHFFVGNRGECVQAGHMRCQNHLILHVSDTGFAGIQPEAHYRQSETKLIY